MQNIPSDTTEATLTLESGNWELCIAAFNNKGEGLVSNSVQTTV